MTPLKGWEARAPRDARRAVKYQAKRRHVQPPSPGARAPSCDPQQGWFSMTGRGRSSTTARTRFSTATPASATTLTRASSVTSRSFTGVSSQRAKQRLAASDREPLFSPPSPPFTPRVHDLPLGPSMSFCLVIATPSHALRACLPKRSSQARISRSTPNPPKKTLESAIPPCRGVYCRIPLVFSWAACDGIDSVASPLPSMPVVHTVQTDFSLTGSELQPKLRDMRPTSLVDHAHLCAPARHVFPPCKGCGAAPKLSPRTRVVSICSHLTSPHALAAPAIQHNTTLAIAFPPLNWNRERIPAGGAVLDMMSSWVSHLPPDVRKGVDARSASHDQGGIASKASLSVSITLLCCMRSD